MQQAAATGLELVESPTRLDPLGSRYGNRAEGGARVVIRLPLPDVETEASGSSQDLLRSSYRSKRQSERRSYGDIRVGDHNAGPTKLKMVGALSERAARWNITFVREPGAGTANRAAAGRKLRPGDLRSPGHPPIRFPGRLFTGYLGVAIAWCQSLTSSWRRPTGCAPALDLLTVASADRQTVAGAQTGRCESTTAAARVAASGTVRVIPPPSLANDLDDNTLEFRLAKERQAAIYHLTDVRAGDHRRYLSAGARQAGMVHRLAFPPPSRGAASRSTPISREAPDDDARRGPGIRKARLRAQAASSEQPARLHLLTMRCGVLTGKRRLRQPVARQARSGVQSAPSCWCWMWAARDAPAEIDGIW